MINVSGNIAAGFLQAPRQRALALPAAIIKVLDTRRPETRWSVLRPSVLDSTVSSAETEHATGS
jgi:hypothetical protein